MKFYLEIYLTSAATESKTFEQNSSCPSPASVWLCQHVFLFYSSLYEYIKGQDKTENRLFV